MHVCKYAAVGMVCLVVLVSCVLVGVLIYFSLTGGNSYTTHERIGGVTCIVIRSRLTDSPREVSCPPVQSK